MRSNKQPKPAEDAPDKELPPAADDMK